VEAEKVTLIITEPTSTPSSKSRLAPEWDKFATDIEYKNRIIFLTGSHDTLTRVVEQAAQYRAIQSILTEFDAERLPDNDPQRQRALVSQDKIILSLRSSIQETFTTLSYPSIDGFRSTDCRIQFQDNQFDGETLIRDTLEKLQKFTNDISSDTFRKKCEARLFGGQQTALWSEIKRRAATLTTWQFHRMDALDSLRNTAISQDIWRDEGGYINKGPFPPPKTEIKIQRISRNDHTGEATLKITPVHEDTIYYEIGDTEPTPSSMRVEAFNGFKTKELRVRYLCVDSKGKHQQGIAEGWQNTINLKYGVYQQGDDWMVELKACPKGEIFYTTNGSDPKTLGAPYEGPFPVPKDCQFVLAIARKDGIVSPQEKIDLIQHKEKIVKLDPDKPAKWKRPHHNLTTRAAFEFMERLKKYNGIAYGITIDVQANDEKQDISYSAADNFSLNGEQFEKLVKQLQGIMPGSQIFLSVERMDFEKGQFLLDWVADAKTQLSPGEVIQ